jgi:hypothetical protein
MGQKPKIELSVPTSEIPPSATGEGWVLDGNLMVSRRFEVAARRSTKLPPRDVAANPADDRKPL